MSYDKETMNIFCCCFFVVNRSFHYYRRTLITSFSSLCFVAPAATLGVKPLSHRNGIPTLYIIQEWRTIMSECFHHSGLQKDRTQRLSVPTPRYLLLVFLTSLPEVALLRLSEETAISFRGFNRRLYHCQHLAPVEHVKHLRSERFKHFRMIACSLDNVRARSLDNVRVR